MGIIQSKEDKTDKKTVHFSLINSNNLLLIFTRNPELGKCKTRLAATLGNQTALDIYNFLLAHTVTITKNLQAAKHVYYSEAIWKNDIWDDTLFDKRLQRGDNLGKRMENAFYDGFESGYNKIIIIGSDVYDLQSEDLEDAFIKLDQHDYVIGPAEDGGYYLLGMKAPNAAIFNNKNWGTATVLQDTLNDLKNKNLFVLETRNDVDRYEDIKDLEAFQPFIKTINEK